MQPCLTRTQLEQYLFRPQRAMERILDNESKNPGHWIARSDPPSLLLIRSLLNNNSVHTVDEASDFCSECVDSKYHSCCCHLLVARVFLHGDPALTRKENCDSLGFDSDNLDVAIATARCRDTGQYLPVSVEPLDALGEATPLCLSDFQFGVSDAERVALSMLVRLKPLIAAASLNATAMAAAQTKLLEAEALLRDGAAAAFPLVLVKEKASWARHQDHNKMRPLHPGRSVAATRKPQGSPSLSSGAATGSASSPFASGSRFDASGVLSASGDHADDRRDSASVHPAESNEVVRSSGIPTCGGAGAGVKKKKIGATAGPQFSEMKGGSYGKSKDLNHAETDNSMIRMNNNHKAIGKRTNTAERAEEDCAKTTALQTPEEQQQAARMVVAKPPPSARLFVAQAKTFAQDCAAKAQFKPIAKIRRRGGPGASSKGPSPSPAQCPTRTIFPNIVDISVSTWSTTVRELHGRPFVEHDSALWHAARFGDGCLQLVDRSDDAMAALTQRCIGASQAAAVVGLDKDLRPHKFFAALVAAPTPNSFAQRAMRHGRDTESVLLTEYARQFPSARLVRLGLLRHAQYPFIAATGDALDYEGEVCIEGKCPYTRKIVTGEIPSKYLPQLAVQQAVLGVPCVYVEYALRDGCVQWNVVRPDPAELVLLFQRMLPILISFRELVLRYARTGVMPRDDEFEVLSVPSQKRKRKQKAVADRDGGGDTMAGAGGSTEFEEPLH